MAPPPHPRTAVLLMVAGGLTACVAPLREEPWQATRAGTLALSGGLEVYEDFQTDSTFVLHTTSGDSEVDVSTDLIGRFGASLGVDWYAWDDLALQGGLAYRIFDDEPIADTVDIGTIDQFSLFAGLRWILPWRWLHQGRLRPYLQANLAWTPTVSFETELDFSSAGQPNQKFDFEGSPYWSAVASGGLLYLLADRHVVRLGVLYEWPLSSTSDSVTLDFLGTPLPTDMDFSPSGLIAFVGYSYHF